MEATTQADDRAGIFAGEDPLAILREWLAEAERAEVNDANAMALATVDAQGMPNVRNRAPQGDRPGRAGVLHQLRERQGARAGGPSACGAGRSTGRACAGRCGVRGTVEREAGARADAYFGVPWPGQPSRRLGLAPVAAAREPRRAGARRGARPGRAGRRARAPSVLGRVSDRALGDRVLGGRREPSARPLSVEQDGS